MREQIEEYAKRLKLSWIREHYHEVQADNHEAFLLEIFRQEIK